MARKLKSVINFLKYLLIALFALGGGALLVVYAQGYRYDFGGHRVLSTGLMLLDSRPGGAKVTVNGRALETTTPTKLDSLYPGDYEVKFEKDGFRSWEKNARVDAGLLTALNYVILIPDHVYAEVAVPKSVAAYKLSNDGKVLGLITVDNGRQTLSRRGVKDAQPELLLDPGPGVTFSDPTWNSNHSALLALGARGAASSLFVVGPGRAPAELTAIAGLPIAASAHIIAGLDANRVYLTLPSASGQTALAELDLPGLTGQVIAASVKGAGIDRDRLLYVEDKSTGPVFSAVKQGSSPPEIIFDTLPVSHHYAVAYSNYLGKNYYALVSPDTKQLFIKSDGALKIISIDAESLLISPDQRFLLAYSESSIAVYDLERDQLFSQSLASKLTAIAWFPDGYHLVFNLSGDVMMMDFDGSYRERLGAAAADSSVEFSIDNKTLYALNTLSTSHKVTNQKLSESFLFGISLDKSFR